MNRTRQKITAQNPGAGWQTPTEALTRFKPEGLAMISQAVAPGLATRYGFRVGDFGFILAVHEKAEIIDQDSICPIPNTPIWFKGMINVRGNLVPVFDLKNYLKIEDGHKAKRLLNIGQGAKSVSLLIDDLPEVVEVNNPATDALPLPAILQTHTRKMYLYNHSIWLDLDFENFFTELGEGIVA